MRIIHLKHKEIDKRKWDESVASGCDLPYMLSWWLDIVSPEWEALVADGYGMLFPLPVKRIGFIKTLQQPVLTQQLGLVCADGHSPSQQEVDCFVNAIPYLSYLVCLNECNTVSSHLDESRINLKLSLPGSHDAIVSRFDSNTKRNLAKAVKASLDVCDIGIGEFVDFYVKNNSHNIVPSSILTSLLDAAERHNSLHIIAVKKGNQVVAAATFIKFNNRLVYLLPVSNSDGRKCRAMFLVVDRVIRDFCGTGIVLDFEGSMEDGVARFYKGFGAEKFRYCRIRRCRPPLLFYIKKTLCSIKGRK